MLMEVEMIAMMTAGNLATTQAVVSKLEERTKQPNERETTLLNGPTMFNVATELGRLLRSNIAEVQASNNSKREHCILCWRGDCGI